MKYTALIVIESAQDMDEVEEFSQRAIGVELAPGVVAPLDAMRVQFSRGSGPGGQNVNKVNSKAELWIDPEQFAGMTTAAKSRLRALAGRRLTQSGEIHLASEIHRSQEANRRELFLRLRTMILAACAEPKPRRKTRPSKAAKQRRLDQKRRRGAVKAHRRSRPNDD